MRNAKIGQPCLEWQASQLLRVNSKRRMNNLPTEGALCGGKILTIRALFKMRGEQRNDVTFALSRFM